MDGACSRDSTMRTTLLATVFLSGGALMSLEMAGFRLLPPYFGDDIEVWGSIISVFLGGLALGAVSGGTWADRGPRLWKLGLILAAAGLAALLLPLYARPVMDWLSGKGAPLPAEWGGDGGVYKPPSLRWQALAAALVMFGPLTLLLGMVSPYAARLFVFGMPKMGADVGRLYGVSTVGSILGTIGTAFYLIAWMGTRGLLVSNGILLATLGVLLGASDLLGLWKRPAR